MKKKLFFLIVLITTLASALSGQIEYQWLIWNSTGKDGVNGLQNNYSNPLTDVMTFTGVATPDLEYHDDARNDLFIIYSDGSHLNTRGVSGLSDFFEGVSGPTPTAHIFNAPAGRNFGYGYLTNIYEVDDLPTGVRITSGASGGGTPISLSTTSPSTLLTATHEVVYAKDITLIIDNEALINFQTQKENTEPYYSLTFDGVQEIGSSTLWSDLDILDLKTVFGTSPASLSAIYPIPPSPPGSGESISLDPTSGPFTYVNLRSNAGAETYAPDKDGSPLYNAIFTLYKNGEPVDQHPEPIRYSHDPNFLRVESICKMENGDYIVTYHLEFENTSETPTKHLYAEVDFPAHFELNCLRAVNWSAKGIACGGRLEISTASPHRVILDIDDHQLIKCTQTAPEQGKGYIQFKVKVIPGYDVTLLSNSLWLDNPTVYFDSIAYPITDFRDLIECSDSTGHAASLSHQAKKTPPEKEEVREKEDELRKPDSEKHKKETEKGENKPKRTILMESGSHHVRCYRPITQGPCDCRKGFNPWLVFGGLALVVLIITFVARKLRNKSTPSSTPPKPNS
jgi:hypothetical protein